MNLVRRAFEKKKKHILFYAFLLTVFTAFVNGLTIFYLPIYLKDIGLSGFQIGILFSISVVVGFIFVFQIGVLTDRFSIRRLIAIGLSLMALYSIGFALTKSFWLLLVFFFISGFGYYLHALSLDSFTLKMVKESMGRMLGIYSAFKSIPFAVGALLGGYALYLFGFKAMLIISAILYLICIYLVFYIPKTSKKVEEVKTYFKDFFKPKILFFSFLIFIFTLHWGVEKVSYTLFLKENLGLSMIQMSWYIAVPIIFLGLASMWFGKGFDTHFSTKRLLVISFVVSGLGFALLAMTTNPWISVFFRIMHEIGDGAFMVFVFIGAKSFFSRYKLGGSYGLITIVTIAGAFFGSLIFSPIGATYGYHVPHIITGILSFVAGFFILLFKKE
ncbi:MFS transporter [Candidatus Woesearchaeota archaeon]|nr:MFS transporter [Candidatus Woesearchaeota archaeon]